MASGSPRRLVHRLIPGPIRRLLRVSLRLLTGYYIAHYLRQVRGISEAVATQGARIEAQAEVMDLALRRLRRLGDDIGSAVEALESLRSSQDRLEFESRDHFAKIEGALESFRLRSTAYLGDHRILTRTTFGQKIVIDTRDRSLGMHLALDGYWEPWVTTVMSETIKPGMAVIDIGANFGYYTLLASSLVGEGGRVIAFEPDPALFDLLFTTVELNGFLDRCECVNKAILGSAGLQPFYKYARHQGDSTLWPEPGRDTRLLDQVETTEVETIGLDEFLVDREVKQVDVVKIDAEGSEGLIIEGMTKTLRANRSLIVICEFCPERIVRAECEPQTTIDLLRDAGFELRYIDSDAEIKPISSEELLTLGDENVMLYLRRPQERSAPRGNHLL